MRFPLLTKGRNLKCAVAQGYGVQMCDARGDAM
jgi:hypothetical protein